jgi:hypothetical protein
MVAPTEGHEDEERASLDTRSVRSNFRRGFFTILDNVLNVGESAELTLTQEASLKDLEGGVRNSAAADFAEALRQ